jgi:hypothetical protein
MARGLREKSTHLVLEFVDEDLGLGERIVAVVDAVAGGESSSELGLEGYDQLHGLHLRCLQARLREEPSVGALGHIGVGYFLCTIDSGR